MIQLNQIKKDFGKGEARQTILKGISLDIKEGEMVSIMGPSGSGKSSLLNILGLLDGMYEGEYLLDGINVADLTEKEQAGLRGEKIGFVFQSFHLLKDLTALDNVKMALILANSGYSSSFGLKFRIRLVLQISIFASLSNTACRIKCLKPSFEKSNT